MREYIEIATGSRIPLVEEKEEENILSENAIISDLKDAVFRLRSIMEMTGSEDYSHGVDIGMSRAADIIENIINRYSSNG